MKLLHDDNSKYTAAQKEDPRDQQRIIPFMPEWVDAEGLLGNLGQWVMDNMQPKDVCWGVRRVRFKSLPFCIRRWGDGQAELQRRDGDYHATFTMENGDVMHVIPGLIEFINPVSKQLVRQYIQYRWTDCTVWKLDMEVTRRYTRNYHDCPAVQRMAVEHMDKMLYHITRVPHQRMVHRFNFSDLSDPTSKNVERAYRWVYSHYCQGPGGPNGPGPDKALYEQMLGLIAHILCDSKIPDMLYDISEQPAPPSQAEQSYVDGVDKLLDAYLGGDTPVAETMRGQLKQHFLDLYRAGGVPNIPPDAA